MGKLAGQEVIDDAIAAITSALFDTNRPSGTSEPPPAR